MDNYYLDRAPQFLERFDTEVPYWIEALIGLHGETIASGLGQRLRDRFAGLLPSLPYIGGDENRRTLSLLDAARCLVFYQELKGELSAFEIGHVLFDAIKLRQRARGKEFYREDRYTPDQVTAYRKRQAALSQKREFSDDYVYEYVEGDGDVAFGYNFLECGAEKLFARHDALEFLPFFCYLDYPKMINSGLRMSREHAISQGDRFCDHRFSVGDPGDIRWPPARI